MIKLLRATLVTLFLAAASCTPLGQPPLTTSGLDPQTPAAGSLPSKGVVQPTGTVTLTIKWPERPLYSAQTIPLRTNSLVIRVTDASGSIAGEHVVVRPNGGTLVTTTNLDIPAGLHQRIDVKAYSEQTPGFDSVSIAEGSALDVAIAPSTQQNVRIVLTPTAGPVITQSPANAGPSSYVTLQGQNFDGWGGEVKVFFGGVPSPYVTGSSTQLLAQVPANAPNGLISVQADGVTGVSTQSCQIIRSLALSPLDATLSVGMAVDLTASAQDASNSIVPNPDVSWAFRVTGPAPRPGSDAPPPSTLTDGHFTPGSTGSFEIRINAGTIVATTSVSVE